MVNINQHRPVYQIFNDKHNDNVICYGLWEVVLCR